MRGRRIVHYRRASALSALDSMSRFPGGAFLISAAAPAQFPPDVGAEVAFVGRSNAGKSSAINAIAQRHGTGAHQQDPRAHAAAEFFRAGAEQATGRPARLRLRERPGSRAAHVAAAHRRPAHARIAPGAVRDRRLHGADSPPPMRGCSSGRCPRQRVHVLLSKADKLNRSEAAAVLQERQRAALVGPRDGAAVLGAEGDRRRRGPGHARGLAQPIGRTQGHKKPRRSLKPPGQTNPAQVS